MLVYQYHIQYHNVPGWNLYVTEKHDAARNAFLTWLYNGKPKIGAIFEAVKRTSAVFKLALRYCKNNIETMRADACPESLLHNYVHKFWNIVYKTSNNKAASHVININGCCGSQNVCNMWKMHYEYNYNSNSKKNSKYQSLFQEKLNNCMLYVVRCCVTVNSVISTVKMQKHDKAAGPDGLHMESFIYGGNCLYVYLTMLFMGLATIEHGERVPPSPVSSVDF